MSKIELPTITSGYNLSTINSNFQKIEDELNNKVLYRDSPTGEPNSMSSNLDMNSRSILNAGKIFSSEISSNKISSNVLELGGVQVVPTNLSVDPYNGAREALRRSYAKAGYNLVDGSFEEGGVISDAFDVLLYKAAGIVLGWGGAVPKTVNPDSTPWSSGGFGPGAWVDKSDSYGALTFINTDSMIDALSNGISVSVGNECTTGATRWRIGTNSAGMSVGSGLYAEPITSVCFDDWGFTSDVSLAADLNAILSMAGAFGINRVYSKGGKTYYTEDTINLSGLDIDLDFGWSVLIDNVQGFRADLSGRAKPTFIQYNSTGSKVRCVNHMIHPSRSQSASGNGADVHYWIGGQQMGTAFTVGPIVEDIILQDTKRGCMPVGVVGNVKNWNVRRFDVYGDASWGVDIEWGWQGTEGSKTGIPEDPAVNQTMENGQIPYNGHVENFNGYELQNCKGFLRTAGCYNTKFENCVGYNVDNFIYVYGGDKNPSVFTQNDRFKGCKLKINRSTFTKPTYGITVLFPNKDGTLGDTLPSWTDYDHTVVFDDCEIQGNYVSGAIQTAGLRFYGCNGAVEFNRCTLKNCYYGARLEKGASNANYTSRFSLEFNNCIFKRNYQDVSLNSIDGVNFNHCKFRSMLGTELPSVGVGLWSPSNYNKFVDCSWSGQNDRSGGVQAFIQLGSGTGNHLVRCRFEPFSSTYKPVEQTGSGVINGYGNSSTGELTLSTNTAKKIIGESLTTTKTTSGLSGSQLDFMIGEVWLTNSAMTINQCINGKSGDRLVIRGATGAAFNIQHNAVAAGSGRLINLTSAEYSHSSDNWAHTYVNSSGDWYEI